MRFIKTHLVLFLVFTTQVVWASSSFKTSLENYKKKNYSQCTKSLEKRYENLNKKELLLLFYCYKQIKDKTKDQVRVLEKMESLDKPTEKTIFLKAQTYYYDKNYDEAIKELRKGINLFPKSKHLHESLLKIFMLTENSYESRMLLQSMKKQFGSTPRYLSLLCKYYYLDGYFDSAISTCREAIKSKLSFPDNYVYLALSQIESNEETKGAEQLVAAATNFKKSALAQQMLSAYYIKKENIPSAYKYAKKSYKLSPENIDVLITFAQASFANEEYQESLDAFNKACKMSRKAIEPFQVAAGKIKQKNNFEFTQKFSQAAHQCRIMKRED